MCDRLGLSLARLSTSALVFVYKEKRQKMFGKWKKSEKIIKTWRNYWTGFHLLIFHLIFKSSKSCLFELSGASSSLSCHRVLINLPAALQTPISIIKRSFDLRCLFNWKETFYCTQFSRPVNILIASAPRHGSELSEWERSSPGCETRRGFRSDFFIDVIEALNSWEFLYDQRRRFL